MKRPFILSVERRGYIYKYHQKLRDFALQTLYESTRMKTMNIGSLQGDFQMKDVRFPIINHCIKKIVMVSMNFSSGNTKRLRVKKTPKPWGFFFKSISIIFLY